MEKVKITKKLFGILRAYTKLYSKIEGEFSKKVGILEKQMQKETGIAEIEFFCCDGEMAGIGAYPPSKMDLIYRNKLEG